MKRIAIIGGGIAGLAAAYELEKRRLAGAQLDWTLYEASDRLGGTVETTLRDGFVLEGGPDAWVADKPWAHDLAVELGLGADIIASNDAARKTYVLIDGELQAMPGRMRMMVPEDLRALDDSPLFSPAARAAYAAELTRAEELKQAAPEADESVSGFIRRHFGEEVLRKIGAPLLGGVFGGDTDKLSVRAVMPAFVAMEREHGSLIAAVQAKAAAHAGAPPKPTFTTLRRGLGSLVDAIVAKLPPDRILFNRPAVSLKREGKLWCLRVATSAAPTSKKPRMGIAKRHFHHVLIAAPAATARALLAPLDPEAAALIPTEATSAVLATFAWDGAAAATFNIPPGFGFLVPTAAPSPPLSKQAEPWALSPGPSPPDPAPSLLACTFIDQKFPNRVPEGCRAIRVFFGGDSAEAFAATTDEAVAHHALTGLAAILSNHSNKSSNSTDHGRTSNQPVETTGAFPPPLFSVVRRWPRSLPQYEVGHPDRMAHLQTRITALGGLTLLGNSYRGVGLPDLIRDARAAATTVAATATA